MAENKEKLVSVQTVGCRLNQYESEKMAAQLYPFGFRRSENGEPADLYIINTCTVTHKADRECRAMIRRAARQNPNGRIVVAGCYVENDPDLILGMEGVDVILNNKEKDAIAEIVPRNIPELFEEEPDKNCSTLITDFHDHNRAWLKISDGCNQWCSFCIIPSVRGRIVNRPAPEIIDEINTLVEHGYKEVVVSGVHLGHYKINKSKPFVKNLAALCKMIVEETDLYRLRISSIEPQTVRDDFLKVYVDANGRICHHMHLPLQSGSSRILKLMRRPYDQTRYVQRVKALKEAVPQTIIGADVIVGFPGETDEDFQRTVNVAESGLIDYLHPFSYSERVGTTASEMPEKVHPTVIKNRNAILTRVSNQIRYESHKRQVGQTLEVISQHKPNSDGSYIGVSGNFIKVRIQAERKPSREIVKIKVDNATQEFVSGQIVK